jgi:hypothetical protein
MKITMLSGNEIKTLRILFKIKLKKLAKELDCTNNYLGLVENEQRKSERIRAKATLYFQELQKEKQINLPL